MRMKWAITYHPVPKSRILRIWIHKPVSKTYELASMTKYL